MQLFFVPFVLKTQSLLSSFFELRRNPCRLQNMILAVGPGTPATAVMIPPTAAHLPSFASSASSASSVHSTSRDSDNENEDFKMEDDEDEEEEKEEKLPKGRAGWVRRPSRNRSGEDEKEEDEDDGDSDDDSDDDSDGDRDSRDRDAARRIVESTLLEWYGRDSGDDDSEEEDESDIRPSASSPVPSIRHGGCINTAAWLDCGWRLSTAGTSCDAVFSEECPTQLVTSGDDHLVKFWDVRHAMGMTSPLPGGYTTICPFSAPNCPDQDVARKSWKSHYAKTQSRRVAGSVLPLVTLQTGHRGNVFHVTPLINQPGKVATCGADGFLRLTDMETGDASVVVSPDCENDLERLLPVGLLSLRPGMCFSHHFLNKSTGLLCSERGLRRFDLRLPPREQPTESLLGGPFRACKACAVWSSPTTASSLEEGDSSYVFGMWTG